MSFTTPCKLAILGAGRIGRLHAENIVRHLPQFQLIGIADPRLDRNWAQSLGIRIQAEDPQTLIQSSEIDALIIASPSDQHLTQISQGSKAGKAIFCEKPLGLDEQEIQRVLAEVEDHKTLLQIGFNRRFDPQFALLQQKIRQGEIGQPHLVKITSRDPACPPMDYVAQSGGIFMDMSIHDFDMARFLVNSEVVEVYASGAVMINPEFERYQDVDTALIQLKFANGALACIDNSRQAVYGYDQRLEVFGSEGMLWVNNQLENQVQGLNQNGHLQAKPQYFFLERYQQAYLQELQAFYQAWSKNEPSPVPGQAGLAALRIAKAAKASLATNQPVKVEI